MNESRECPHCGTMTYTDGTCSDSTCHYHLQPVVDSGDYTIYRVEGKNNLFRLYRVETKEEGFSDIREMVEEDKKDGIVGRYVVL